MSRYDGSNTGAARTGRGPDAPLERRWTFEADDFVEGGPVIANGLVYVGSRDHRVYAIDAETGDRSWAVDTGGAVFRSPCAADGRLYATSRSGQLLALEGKTGDSVWTYAVGEERPGAAVATEDFVAVGGRDLHVVDAERGERVFRRSGSESDEFERPALVDWRAFVGRSGGTLAALDLPSGEVIWRVDLGRGPVGTPAVASGTVFVSTSGESASLYAIDATDGSVRWVKRLPGRRIAPLVLTESLVVAAVSGEQPRPADFSSTGGTARNAGGLFAFDVDSGEPVWRRTEDRYGDDSAADAGPVVVGNVLYGPFRNDIVAVDVGDGRERWRAVEGFPTISYVVAAGGRLYARHGLSKVFAFDPAG